MSKEKVRIEVEFDVPQGHSLEECCNLVMLQMRTPPVWSEGEEGGTGHLNYVCFDRTLRVVSAKVV